MKSASAQFKQKTNRTAKAMRYPFNEANQTPQKQTKTTAMTNLSLFNSLRDLDLLTNRLFGNDALTGGVTGKPWSPSVDITEDENAYRIVVDLPEVPKDAVKITVENGVLTIRGERKWEKKNENSKYHLLERSYGSFTRSFRLPDDADGTGVTASFKEGVLNVALPKREEAKPRQVDVKID